MTELQQRAREAWAAMDDRRSKIQRIHDAMTGHRGVMAPEVALDYVQDVCGDREEAFRALCGAGADSLAEHRPHEVPIELYWACLSDAMMIDTALRGGLLAAAGMLLDRVEDRLKKVLEDGADEETAKCAYAWGAWDERLETTLARCDQINAATAPQPAAA